MNKEDCEENYHPIDTWEVLRKEVTRLVVMIPEQCRPNSFGFAAGRKTINGIMDLFEEYLKKPDKDNCEILGIDKQYAEEILEACSHEAVLLYLKSEKREPFLRAMTKHGYELRVVKKGQCY